MNGAIHGTKGGKAAYTEEKITYCRLSCTHPPVMGIRSRGIETFGNAPDQAN